MEDTVSAVPGSSHYPRQNPRLGYYRHKKVKEKCRLLVQYQFVVLKCIFFKDPRNPDELGT